MRNYIFTANDMKRALRAKFPQCKHWKVSLAKGKITCDRNEVPSDDIMAYAKYVTDHEEEFAGIRNISSKLGEGVKVGF